jgi:hypothetical protein
VQVIENELQRSFHELGIDTAYTDTSHGQVAKRARLAWRVPRNICRRGAVDSLTINGTIDANWINVRLVPDAKP